ncbi:MAG: hypothetical protein L0H59_01255 [Tomitella sp.]|nr:hypothetical protein [Tomitella sp.]
MTTLLMVGQPGGHDRDDAVHVAARPDGGWRGSGYIADAARHVPAGPDADLTAFLRRETRYMSGRMIPRTRRRRQRPEQTRSQKYGSGNSGHPHLRRRLTGTVDDPGRRNHGSYSEPNQPGRTPRNAATAPQEGSLIVLDQPFPTITAEDAHTYDPRHNAPPVVTSDGDVQAVGEAHGRIAPLVGSYRPYIYDVALRDGRRIYADTVDDVLSVMLGARYGEVTQALWQAEASAPPAPAESTSHVASDIDWETPVDTEDAATTDDVAAFDAYMDAAQQISRYHVELAGLRYKHADQTRIMLQQDINADARADDSWDALTDEQRAELETAADPDGKAPAGVLTERPTMVEDDDGMPQPGTITRGVWFAEVPLAVNTGDYAPWTNLPFPESALLRADDSGEEIEMGTHQNLVILRVDTPDDYLTSLTEAETLTMTVTSPQPPDDFFREANNILLSGLGWEVEEPETAAPLPQ